MYIVLEGVVGTGKSTQSRLLADWYEAQGREVVLVREPGGTEIAEAIRTLVQATEFGEKMHAVTDAYLYASARAQLIYGLVKPALDRGAVVISDRNVCSSLAIQGVAQGVGLERIWEINAQAVGEVLPDVILFLDLDVDVGLARTFDASGDKFERKPASFSHAIYEGYQQLFAFAAVKERMRRVDADGSVEEVHGRIVAEVTTHH